MEPLRINLNKLLNDTLHITGAIKLMLDTGWLLSDQKGKKIILEVDSLNDSPIILKILFVALSEGIINSNERKAKIKIDYNEFNITDYKSMAIELTKVTNVKFSLDIIPPKSMLE